MSLQVKLCQIDREGMRGKWFGRAVRLDEVHTEELARNIQRKCTLTTTDVIAVIDALVGEMKNELGDGRTVVLDGFGRFHLTVQSELVDNKEDFNVLRHIKRVLCKFTPDAHRKNLTDRKLVRTFCDGTAIKRYFE